MNEKNTKQIVNKLKLKTIYDNQTMSMDEVLFDIKLAVSDLDDIIDEFKISYSFKDVDYDSENIIYLTLDAVCINPIVPNPSDSLISTLSDFQANSLKNSLAKYKGLSGWDIVEIKSQYI